MSTESTAIIIPTIEDTLKEVANAQDNAVALRNGFASHFEKLNELVTQAKTITVLQPKGASQLPHPGTAANPALLSTTFLGERHANFTRS